MMRESTEKDILECEMFRVIGIPRILPHIRVYLISSDLIAICHSCLPIAARATLDFVGGFDNGS